MGVLLEQVGRAGDARGLRSDQGELGRLEGRLLELGLMPDPGTADPVEQFLEADPVSVEREAVLGEGEHPDDPEQLPLRAQHPRLASLPRGHGLDVVGELALEQGGRVGAVEDQPPAMRAIDDSAT